MTNNFKDTIQNISYWFDFQCVTTILTHFNILVFLYFFKQKKEAIENLKVNFLDIYTDPANTNWFDQIAFVIKLKLINVNKCLESYIHIRMHFCSFDNVFYYQ